MIVTTVVSKVVSYFASDQQWNSKEEKRKRKLKVGSWLLLIRITIIVLGLFLAFAAAGIPMDKITLILGALGVGVGFGLQTLVNNLVSGLIIAFEKPVNVGDVIEVGGQGGTVKSIGFRSSVISTVDGADLVLPNGDLLNSHVINWTLGGYKKRMHIVLRVTYDSDLQHIRDLLLLIMGKQVNILTSPMPVVQYNQFAASAIDIDLYFWVRSSEMLRRSEATLCRIYISISGRRVLSFRFHNRIFILRPELKKKVIGKTKNQIILQG